MFFCFPASCDIGGTQWTLLIYKGVRRAACCTILSVKYDETAHGGSKWGFCQKCEQKLIDAL